MRALARVTKHESSVAMLPPSRNGEHARDYTATNYDVTITLSYGVEDSPTKEQLWQRRQVEELIEAIQRDRAVNVTSVRRKRSQK